MFVTRSGGGPGPAAAAVVNCGRVFGIFCPVWNISQSQQPRGNILTNSDEWIFGHFIVSFLGFVLFSVNISTMTCCPC